MQNNFYATDAAARLIVRQRRAALRQAGRCINGPAVGNFGKHGAIHGPVVKAGKCQRCIEIHARSR
jgi:hypothetical protein